MHGIFLKERPIAVASSSPASCDHCLEATAPYKCGSCAATFCGFECKNAAWSHHHSLLCGYSPKPVADGACSSSNVAQGSDGTPTAVARRFPVLVAKLLTSTFLELTRP